MTNTTEQPWGAIRDTLLDDGAHPLFVDVFRQMYHHFERGQSPHIPEDAVTAAGTFPTLQQLSGYADRGRAIRRNVISIKLNGGLGTSMGLTGAKGLLEVREGLSLIEMAIHQSHCDRIPLLLMNSYRTSSDTESHFDSCLADSDTSRPHTFSQHRAPRLDAESYLPLGGTFGDDRWCPPGHGDIYTALHSTGLIHKLIKRGFRYAFVTNIDNCGATVCDEIVGYMNAKRLSFVMEVTQRTAEDTKGGHLCRRAHDQRLMLRERAQCPVEDLNHFQNTTKHRLFNTNTLWLDLNAIAVRPRLAASLPLIVNEKCVLRSDGTKQRVYQLETAMGAALTNLERASVVEVPRSRFAPIKHIKDWIGVRSDQFRMTERYKLERTRTQDLCEVHLGPSVSSIDDVNTLFSDGIPSLQDCERVEFTGRVRAWAGMSLHGSLQL